jgi:hypothetical protein
MYSIAGETKYWNDGIMQFHKTVKHQNSIVRNSSPPLLILLSISEQGLTIYDFRSIIDSLSSDSSSSTPS